MSAKEAVGKVKHTADHYINYVCCVHTKNSCGVDIHPVLKKKGGKVLGISVGWSDPINTILNDLLVSFISKATRVYTKTNHTPTSILFRF